MRGPDPPQPPSRTRRAVTSRRRARRNRQRRAPTAPPRARRAERCARRPARPLPAGRTSTPPPAVPLRDNGATSVPAGGGGAAAAASRPRLCRAAEGCGRGAGPRPGGSSSRGGRSLSLPVRAGARPLAPTGQALGLCLSPPTPTLTTTPPGPPQGSSETPRAPRGAGTAGWVLEGRGRPPRGCGAGEGPAESGHRWQARPGPPHRRPPTARTEVAGTVLFISLLYRTWFLFSLAGDADTACAEGRTGTG